jgi:hypothetical protein
MEAVVRNFRSTLFGSSRGAVSAQFAHIRVAPPHIAVPVVGFSQPFKLAVAVAESMRPRGPPSGYKREVKSETATRHPAVCDSPHCFHPTLARTTHIHLLIMRIVYPASLAWIVLTTAQVSASAVVRADVGECLSSAHVSSKLTHTPPRPPCALRLTRG